MRWRMFTTPVAAMGLLLASCGTGDDTSSPPDDTASSAVTSPADESGGDPTTTVRTVRTVPETTPDTTDSEDGDDAESDDAADDDVTTTAPRPETTVAEDPPSSTTEPIPSRPERDDLPGLVDRGDVDVTIGVPEGGVSGELFEVSITNVSDDDRSILVPCGLVFTPAGGDDQRMMNLRPLEIDLAPGESADVTPYVMCIDGSSPAPDAGAAYLVGAAAGGDLAALAECVCASGAVDEIGPLDEMSLQMAVWAVSDGSLPEIGGALEQGDSALGDLVGDQAGIDFEEIAELLDAQDLPGMEGIDIEALLAQAATFLDSYLADAQAWIDRCEIDLSG